MKITKNSLDQAVSERIISANQAEKLYAFLRALPASGPSFDFTHVLYYMGGLVAIGAMTLFMNLGWENFGGVGILCISTVYFTIGLTLANNFRRKGLSIPAGICATFAITMTPLAIYGFQLAIGWWPEGSTYREYHHYIKWHWIFLELGTLASGAIIAWIYRYPFLQMPIAVTLWYLSMDLAAMLVGNTPSFELRSQVSLWFGLVTIVLAFFIDYRSRKFGDYAFWLYISGVLAFWGGMTSMESNNELSKLFYFCINLLLIGCGVVIVRRVFVIFGAIGCSLYLGHLAAGIFKDSFLFPVVLTAIGLLIIYLGIFWQKNEQKITKNLRSLFPRHLRQLLEERSR